MLTIYNLIGTSFVCGFQLNKKSLYYTCYHCCYHCLILTLIFHLKVLINFFLFFFTIIIIVVIVVVVLLLFIIYTINLHVVRPRSCRVIYYFDTPALGRRHQSFGRVICLSSIPVFFSMKHISIDKIPVVTLNVSFSAQV